MRFLHAQVHAAHGNVSCEIIQVAYQGKNGNSNQHIYSESLQSTESRDIPYENIFKLSIPIYGLSRWYLLACEAHPNSSAKCIETDSR